MKDTRLTMGMPVTVELIDDSAKLADIEAVFHWFTHIDETFSTYKPTSAISKINNGQLNISEAGPEVQHIFQLAELTQTQTNGFFDIHHHGHIDPSGIVKGWAIEQAADLLRQRGLKNFFVEAGGDIAVAGLNAAGQPWRIGIRNPFNREENVKILAVTNGGVATSGSYIRGEHIYNPKTGRPANDIASLTVVGPNIYEADRFATAAYAMGLDGITFIEQQPGLEGHMIDYAGQATMTSGLKGFILE